MKKELSYLLLLTLFFFTWSCSEDKDEPEDVLKISETQLSFKALGETQSFSIESNTKWEISKNLATWCNISPISGQGNATITVRATENANESRLTGQLVVRTKTKNEPINVQQEAALTPEGYYIPLLTITTQGGKPITSKEDYINGTITIESRDEKGIVTKKLVSATTEIRGRGNSTWSLMDKKPYRMKLNESQNILDMPKSKHWVLLANYSDKTLMRNELAFEISRRMGFAYTPRMKYVDVKLNGDYIGNYMLGEHIRIDKNRINIPELKATDTDITGGYLLEIDERYGEPEWFETQKAKMIFCIKSPENIPINQKEYILNYIQKIEDIIYGKNGANPVEELPKYVDMKSFIDYLLLNEISKNVDGNLRLSTFVYKNRGDDKLYFGPVWDYDIAFGNVDYDQCNYTHGWHARKVAPWYQEFFSHIEFNNMVKDRWKELRNNELNDLDSFIDSQAQKIEISQHYNFKRWQILNIKVWPNPVINGSYKGEISYLKNWLTNRIDWIDSQLN